MGSLFLLVIKIIVGVVMALIGYSFLRWLVSTLSFDKATKYFDRIKNTRALSQLGEFILVVIFIALLGVFARIIS